MSNFTSNPWTSNPWTTTPFTANPWRSDDLFRFTNTGGTLSPYIAVTGAPDILWTWSDGTTDNKAIPDEVTCTGNNTLYVSDWDAVTYLRFTSQSLTGGIITQEWLNVTNIYFYNNQYNSNFVLRAWPNVVNLKMYSNQLHSISGSFQTQTKMKTCFFQDNYITSSVQIDKMLSDLVINAADPGRTDVCIVDFSGGTNSGPTSAGTANKDILVNTYGWTVTLNAEVAGEEEAIWDGIVDDITDETGEAITE